MCPTKAPAPVHAAPRYTAPRLIALACVVAVAIALTAALYPGSKSLFEATPGWTPTAMAWTAAWILAQSIFLMVPGLLFGLSIVTIRPRIGFAVGSVWCFGVALVVLCDVVTFNWIAERFLSRKMLSIASELPLTLAQHVPLNTSLFLSCLGIAFFVFVIASLRLSNGIANRFSSRLSVPWTLLSLTALSIVLAAPAMWNLRTTLTAMHSHSARFPLCSLRLYPPTSARKKQNVAKVTPKSEASFDAIVQNFQRRRETVSLIENGEPSPDVLIVVIESMRSELVDPQTMPNLWQYAQDGIHCRYHFSAGNATNHGMFSIVNGIDATLYERFSRTAPLLNRLFRDAGYETGFFAGHDDWQDFRMDGFIHADHFDRFQIDQLDWLESDRRSTERARAFLDEDRQTRAPRLAILYLYSTHADYHSYPQDQIFKPAADDRFLIPFSAAARPAVWNRYKNSAHCVDRFLSAVLTDDRVVVVTGDHGESFLEDGVCGHGVRISKFQNMTPAIIYVPDGEARTIDAPTSHADLLPTLITAAGMRSDDATVFSGIDLISATSQELTDRVIATRDYLSDQFALIDNSHRYPNKPFAILAEFSQSSGTATWKGAIDEKGDLTEHGSRDGVSTLMKWDSSRFGQ